MKFKLTLRVMALALLALATRVAAQGTAFTYQGQLTTSGIPLTGVYNMSFTLYSASTGGVDIGGPVFNNDVAVTNGLFTVVLDFGPAPFTGNPVWLGIAVGTNGAPTLTSLMPRQELTPEPYSIYAAGAGTAANFGGTIGGDISGSLNDLIVNTVGGVLSSNIAAAASAASEATDTNAANAIVSRDSTGSFSAGSVTLNGTLNLPYPATMNSGGRPFLLEGTSLYVGLSASNGMTAAINPTPLYNAGFGDDSLAYEATSTNAAGAFNTAVGDYALLENATGSLNTAVGEESLFDNTIGSANTAVGTEALYGNAIGSYNTAAGLQALANNLWGSNNTAVGTYALVLNTNGADNTALGAQALFENTDGAFNTAAGFQALAGNSSGSQSTALGFQALANNTNGGDNTAAGYAALWSNASGSYNTGIGVGALLNNSTGTNNTALGFEALGSDTGNNNIAIGVGAGVSVTEDDNIEIGNPGTTVDEGIIRIGDGQTQTFIAGVLNGDGGGLFDLNTTNLVGTLPSQALGGVYSNAVSFLDPSNSITGIFNGNGGGLNSLNAASLTGTVPSGGLGGVYSNVVSFIAPGNSISGDGSGLTFSNLSTTGNVTLGGSLNLPAPAIINSGTNVLIVDEGSLYIGENGTVTPNGGDTLHNTGVGDYALNGEAVAGAGGTYNTAFGEQALYHNTAGFENVASGAGALYYNTNGSHNTANGYNTLAHNLVGSENNAIGYSALYSNTIAGGNTADGAYALYDNTSGNNNIALGYLAGYNNTTGSSNIYVGNPGTVSDGGVIRLGVEGTQTTTFIAGIYDVGLPNSGLPVFVDSAGQLGTSQTISPIYLGTIPNTNLIGNGSLTVIAGTGLSGGGSVSLGNSVTLAIGTVPSTGLSGSYPNAVTFSNIADTFIGDAFIGNGSGLSNVVAISADSAASLSTGAALGTGAGNSIPSGGATNSFIGGGSGNYVYAGSQGAVISGGSGNTVSSAFSTVPGGYENAALGAYTLAAGQQAIANDQGDFVWADSQNAQFSSTANDQFLIRARGGVGINTNAPEQALSINGGLNVDQGNANAGYLNGIGGFFPAGTNYGISFGYKSGEGISSQRTSGTDQYSLDFYTGFSQRMIILSDGYVGIGTNAPVYPLEMGSGAYCSVGGAWTSASDRNAKKDFTAINAREVLEKVSALPISEWQYKIEPGGIRHIGPMAQDFHAAFGLNGGDDKHISTVDEGGVALAAIQGLNQKLEEQRAENVQLKEELDEMKAELKSLEKKKGE